MSGQPLTYEGILELFQAGIREIQEMRLTMEKRDAEYAREKEKRDAEYAREKEKRDAEYDKMRKDLNRKIGDLTGSIGRIIEHMLGERIIEKFQALGYGVTHPVRRNCTFVNTKMGIEGEFDLTLVDTDTIILISVKTTLKTKDVRRHLKKIKEFRRHIEAVGFKQPPFTHLLPTTRFFGAVAGAVAEKEAIDFAHQNGLYVIVQSGEAVEIVPTPEGFQAKEW